MPEATADKASRPCLAWAVWAHPENPAPRLGIKTPDTIYTDGSLFLYSTKLADYTGQYCFKGFLVGRIVSIPRQTGLTVQ